MTGDATLRSIYFAADETIADLERLHATTEASRSRARMRLDAVVAGLDGTFAEEPVVRSERRERASADRGTSTPDPTPFVALPVRTTRGGPYGPAVRDRLTREALARQGW